MCYMAQFPYSAPIMRDYSRESKELDGSHQPSAEVAV